MRWIASLQVIAIAIAAAPQPERADALVKAAVVAAGGSETLAKYPAGRAIGTGTMTFAGIETPFTCEQTYQIPGKLRTVVRCEVKKQKWELLQVTNGEKAAQTINGRPVPATELSLKELQLAALLNEVAQLTPLLTDKKFAIKFEKPMKPADALAMLVQVKGHPELRLGFDRKTGHLVRIAYKSSDPDTAKDAETEMIFSEFREVSGLTKPTRTVVSRDGRKVLDLVVERFTPLGKVDPKAFTVEE